MSFADRISDTLARCGLNVTIQQLVASGGDLDATQPQWQDLATVKALWDNPRRAWKGVADGGQASTVQRNMTIAYRSDIKAPSAAVGLRVLVNGVPHHVVSIGEMAEQAGLRLLLEGGTEA